MNLLIAVLLFAGLFFIVTVKFPGVYRPAAIALRKRGPKPPNTTERMANFLGHKLLPIISIDDPAKFNQLKDALKNLGSNDSPELYKSKAMCKAGILAIAAGVTVMLFSTFIGAITSIVLFLALYQGEMKRLDKQLRERRQIIERELPQFSSTICQSLRSTRDVESILASYRKVCGSALAGEIDHTLNDMLTGNPERALKALESRVNSPQLSQLTRGLVAVLRGEEQSVYFQVLATEFLKAQDEEVTRELEKRPEKLYPNMALLFLCLIIMIIAALGPYIMHQASSLS